MNDTPTTYQSTVVYLNRKTICKGSKEEKEKYSGKWMIFDYDGHDDFWDAIKFARKNGFQVAFSSMCIEYWFVLHFENHDGNPIPIKEGSHSKAQIEMINKYIGQYNKKNKLKANNGKSK